MRNPIDVEKLLNALMIVMFPIWGPIVGLLAVWEYVTEWITYDHGSYTETPAGPFLSKTETYSKRRYQFWRSPKLVDTKYLDINGDLHRTNGPAIELPIVLRTRNGTRRSWWYINGSIVNPDEIDEFLVSQEIDTFPMTEEQEFLFILRFV